MAGRLEGKRAVIAGVGSGMGTATAVRFADEGAHVFLAARTEERLVGVVETIRSRGGDADAMAVDLTADTEVATLLKAGTQRMGGTPEILVNVVGGWKPGAADEHDAATTDSMLRLNLKSIMTTTPIFSRAMAEAGGGVIVNISSSFGGAFPSRGQAAYNATKAGARAYTESAAADLLMKNVRVNCVLPGGTAHEYKPDRDISKLRTLGKDQTGMPEDIASAIVFLASDEASWVTGASLTVDGGASVRR